MQFTSDVCSEYIRKMIELIVGSEIDSLEEEGVLEIGFYKYMELKI